jgi:hypothetical protein
MNIGPLFCFAKGREASAVWRAWHGEGPQDILLDPNGPILCPASHPSVPAPAQNPLRWCGLGEVTSTTSASKLTIPGFLPDCSETFVLRVVPVRNTRLYVVDNAPFERKQEELGFAASPRTRLNDAEVEQAYIARAATMVPVSEYSGGYSQPFVLAAGLRVRDVRLVSGPWPGCGFVHHLTQRPAFFEAFAAAVLARQMQAADFTEDRCNLVTNTTRRLVGLLEDDKEFAELLEVTLPYSQRQVDRAVDYALIAAATYPIL